MHFPRDDRVCCDKHGSSNFELQDADKLPPPQKKKKKKKKKKKNRPQKYSLPANVFVIPFFKTL